LSFVFSQPLWPKASLQAKFYVIMVNMSSQTRHFIFLSILINTPYSKLYWIWRGKIRIRKVEEKKTPEFAKKKGLLSSNLFSEYSKFNQVVVEELVPFWKKPEKQKVVSENRVLKLKN